MVEIPKKHKAVVYDKPGTCSTKIVEVDTPEPGPGQVLVRLTHSGICHSDYAIMTNSWQALPIKTQPGQVGGHEGVGEIVKMGPGTENSSRKVGDRVGIKWLSGICGSCPPCLSGHEGCCFNVSISGVTTPGTFQEYALGPADYVTPIPEGVGSDEAAPMLCAGVTVYSALRKSGAQSGDWVVILGAGGGLGHLACQIASRSMGMRVIGVDAGSKEKTALESGAEVFINHAVEGGADAKVLEVTGGLGAQAAIVCTSANPAYASALMMLKFGGTAVCVGLPEGELQAIASANPAIFVFKELNLRGSAVGDRKEAIDTLDLLARKLLKTKFTVVGMDKVTETFEKMEKGELQGRVVLDLSK